MRWDCREKVHAECGFDWCSGALPSSAFYRRGDASELPHDFKVDRADEPFAVDIARENARGVAGVWTRG